MILKVFSVLDRKSCYLRPFFEKYTANALRSFEEACKETSSPFHKFPLDYILYEVGTFNEETGVLEKHQTPVMQATAADFIGTVNEIKEVK